MKEKSAIGFRRGLILGLTGIMGLLLVGGSGNVALAANQGYLAPAGANSGNIVGGSGKTSLAPSKAGAQPAVKNNAQAAATPQDWPMFLNNPERSGASGETILNATNAPTLVKNWSYLTGGPVVDSAAVVAGVAYVGSWDGYEYALNATTGAFIWKQNLGTNTDANCSYPVTAGITSAATVINGVVYVGGGDDGNGNNTFFALNASTGAVEWTVNTGPGGPVGAHYNWSSPLIYNGYAYIGIASNCDNPLVQGQLMQVSLGGSGYPAAGTIVNTANFVPNGQVGGGIWTSPTVDPATNTIFVSTGTINQYTQTLSQAVVGLNATTLQILNVTVAGKIVPDAWQLPFEAETFDSDWGTTPTLTSDTKGDQLLSLANKNGVLYAFNRNNLAAGPVWQYALAPGGACPTCGDGTISSGVFVSSLAVTEGPGSASPGTVYTGPVEFFASGNTVVNGVGYQGMVRAFNPGTGALLWSHATNGPIVAALAYDNGLIIDPQGTSFEVLNAANGYSIYDYNLAQPLYGAASVSMGQIYFGGLDGNLYAFGLPASVITPPADPNCPTGFTCQDIGNSGGHTGSESPGSNGSENVVGYGQGGRNNKADAMRLISEPVTGDFQLGVEDLNETGGVYSGPFAPQVGIMIRQSNDPGAPMYTALQDPTYPNEKETVANLIINYRPTWNSPSLELEQEYPDGFPAYVMVERHGDTFETLTSSDGKNYFLVPGTTQTIVMPTTLLGGVGVASGGTTASSTATYANLSYQTPPTQTFFQYSTQHACPNGWTCQSVNNPNPAGDQVMTLAGGAGSAVSGTIYGGGYEIQSGALSSYGETDSFHYVGQTVRGDQTISGEFTGYSGSGINANAESGLMMRASTDPNAPYYGIFIYPNGTGMVQWRSLPNIIDRAAFLPLSGLPSPVYLQITRYTDTRFSPAPTYYSAATSSDGVNWNTVIGSTAVIDMGGGQTGPTLMGIAADANASRQLVASTYSNVSITPTTSPSPGVCPNGWSCQDVGSGHIAGNQTYLGTTFTVQASGDLFGVYDQFRYVSTTPPLQPSGAVTPSGTVSARVVSVSSNAGEWEKSGVMIRSGGSAGASDPEAPYYAALTTPQHGLMVTWRNAEGGDTNTDIPGITVANPVYLMATWYTDAAHNVDYLAAYYSTDNKNWTLIPGSIVVLNLLNVNGQPPTVGLVSTAFNNTVATSTYDSFSTLGSAPAPPGICPSAWQCEDIGGAAPAGTQNQAGTNWTYNASGSDIWGSSDQFHFDWQALPADGTASAEITGVSNGMQWAKGGIMLRSAAGDPDPGAAYYGVFATPNTGSPSSGVVVQWRATEGGSSNQITVAASGAVYVEVDRYTQGSGANAVTYYEALTSPDGNTWTVVPGSLMTLPGLTGSLEAGVATDSWNQGNLATWSMSNVAVNPGVEMAPAGICPANWTCADVGGAMPNGGQNLSSGAWSVTAGGSDIWTGSDSFRLVGEAFPGAATTGDGTFSAEITGQTNTSAWAKAGLMIRATGTSPVSPLDPSAAYYGVLATPGNGIVVQWRVSEGAASNQVSLAGGTVPNWLEIVRWSDASGTYYSAYTSVDGTNWAMIPGSTQALSLTGPLMAGMAVTSHNNGVLGTATFSAVTETTNEVAPANACPQGMTCADVGGALPAGSQAQSGGTTTVQGGGTDIWGTSDQMRLLGQAFPGAATTGDGTFSAEISSQTNTSAWAKAGLMIRATGTNPASPLDPSAAYYGVLATPGNGIVVQWRASEGATSNQVSLAGGTVPNWLEIVRWSDTSGTYYSAYTSGDGTNWVIIPGSTQALSLAGPLMAGLVVTSHNGGVLSTASFSSIGVTSNEVAPPYACPQGMTCADVGGAKPAGTQALSGGTMTLQGGGSDIWVTSDQMRLVGQAFPGAATTGDGTFSAEITSQTNTSAWAKAGLMIRGTGTNPASALDPSAAYYGVLATPSNGVVVQWRASEGANSNSVGLASGTVPVYLEVTRWTDSSGASPIVYYTAYTSSNGTSWTEIPGSTKALNLPGPLTAALVVSSHNGNALSTVAFSAITIATAEVKPAEVCPASMTCADYGAVGIAGGQSQNGSAWTVNASGSDIWGTSDQFHYVAQSFTGNTTISTQVSSLGNGSSNAWAKAGLMVRVPGDAGAANYAVLVTPGNGIVVQDRLSEGATSNQVTSMTGGVGIYLEIVVNGDVVTADTSSNGTSWTLIPGSSVTIPAFTGSLLGGLAVTSHDNGNLISAGFTGSAL